MIPLGSDGDLHHYYYYCYYDDGGGGGDGGDGAAVVEPPHMFSLAFLRVLCSTSTEATAHNPCK